MHGADSEEVELVHAALGRILRRAQAPEVSPLECSPNELRDICGTSPHIKPQALTAPLPRFYQQIDDLATLFTQLDNDLDNHPTNRLTPRTAP